MKIKWRYFSSCTMGTVCSLYSNVDITDNKQIKFFLSSDEVRLVKSSWKSFNKKETADIGLGIFFRYDDFTKKIDIFILY